MLKKNAVKTWNPKPNMKAIAQFLPEPVRSLPRSKPPLTGDRHNDDTITTARY
ncbi:MAG: hypothetical protein ACR2LR_19255 [Hassallia sp.]